MDTTVQTAPASQVSHSIFRWVLFTLGIIIVLLLMLDILTRHYPIIVGSDYRVHASSDANKIAVFLPFDKTHEAIYASALIYEFDGTVRQILQSAGGEEIILDQPELPKFYITSSTNFFLLQQSTQLTPSRQDNLKVDSKVRLRYRYSLDGSSANLESVLIKVL